jgi:hypothetical protein
MATRIKKILDEAIAGASSETERAALLDAQRVFEIVRRIKRPSHRQIVIATLEQLANLSIMRKSPTAESSSKRATPPHRKPPAG